MFPSELREFPSAPCLVGKKNLMTTRVSMLLKSRASPDMLPFSLCYKKRLCNSENEQSPLFNDVIDSILPYRDVGRAQDLSAPGKLCVMSVLLAGKAIFVLILTKSHFLAYRSLEAESSGGSISNPLFVRLPCLNTIQQSLQSSSFCCSNLYRVQVRNSYFPRLHAKKSFNRANEIGVRAMIKFRSTFK